MLSGADPGFQVRGGALKKIAPSGGRREIFLGYFVWKITILRQKIIFFSNCGGSRENGWGISCKKHDFTPKIIFFPSFRGGGAGCAPPGSAPAIVSIDKTIYQGWIQDLWLGGVSRRGVWGPLKVPSWSRVEPW